MIPQDPALDDNGGISLKIPVIDLARGIGRDPENDKAIIVLLTSKSEGDWPPDALDAWNARGLYRDSIVELDYAVGWYRVYPDSGYPIIWQYFESPPDATESTRTGWIASCTARPGSQEKVSLSDVSCRTTLIFMDTESQITVSGEIVSQLDVILRGYEGLLGSWVVQ
jgi:hypothetical protein